MDATSTVSTRCESYGREKKARTTRVSSFLGMPTSTCPKFEYRIRRFDVQIKNVFLYFSSSFLFLKTMDRWTWTYRECTEGPYDGAFFHVHSSAQSSFRVQPQVDVEGLLGYSFSPFGFFRLSYHLGLCPEKTDGCATASTSHCALYATVCHISYTYGTLVLCLSLWYKGI